MLNKLNNNFANGSYITFFNFLFKFQVDHFKGIFVSIERCNVSLFQSITVRMTTGT